MIILKKPATKLSEVKPAVRPVQIIRRSRNRSWVLLDSHHSSEKAIDEGIANIAIAEGEAFPENPKPNQLFVYQGDNKRKGLYKYEPDE
jgi:hypothetical protein